MLCVCSGFTFAVRFGTPWDSIDDTLFLNLRPHQKVSPMQFHEDLSFLAGSLS
jgi:hypothetical protein